MSMDDGRFYEADAKAVRDKLIINQFNKVQAELSTLRRMIEDGVPEDQWIYNKERGRK